MSGADLGGALPEVRGPGERRVPQHPGRFGYPDAGRRRGKTRYTTEIRYPAPGSGEHRSRRRVEFDDGNLVVSDRSSRCQIDPALIGRDSEPLYQRLLRDAQQRRSAEWVDRVDDVRGRDPQPIA